MNRLPTFMTLLATLCVSGWAVAQETSDRPHPNILHILTDQLFADAISCAGNPHVKTPAIDRLAERGVRFAEAYCTSPVCCPSRGSIVTGLFPHQHGVVVNDRVPMKKEVQEIRIGHLMAGQGYDCLYAGKWHVTGADRKAYRVLCGTSDTRVTDVCAAHFRQEHERPFFMTASYLNPHDICIWAKGARKGYQADPVAPVPLDQCPPLPSNYDVAGDEPSVLRSFYMSRHREYASFNAEKWRHYQYAYYRIVEALDREIGELLSALDESNMKRKTLIFLTSDHGDGIAAHQWLGKCTHYEESVRVPFIASLDGVIEPGRVDRQHLVSAGPDFYATALDYAGVPIPKDCEGRSLRGLLEDDGSPGDWRDQVVSEIWVPGNSPGKGEGWKSAWGRMVRTNKYKYAVYNEGQFREQLFDMHDDRGETRNLAASPEHRDVLTEHRRRLAAWCQRTNDAAFIPCLVSP